MGSGPHLYPGFQQWNRTAGGNLTDYLAWLKDNGYATGNDYVRALRDNPGGVVAGPGGPQFVDPNTGRPYPMPNRGNIPVPGQTGGATQGPASPPPPTAIPPAMGSPGFAPPPVQMPQMLPNPTSQGLGGMPMIRDRMMSQVMAPFAQPNWGIPQVPPQYLTQQMPLPGGSTAGIAPAAPAVIADPRGMRGGWMGIPRRVPIGSST